MQCVYNQPTKRVLNTTKGLTRMTFLIEGLPRGRADSVANCIRRNLIGYIPGLAPAAIKILGANQPYMVPKHLLHDTTALSIMVKDLKILVIDPKTGEPPEHVVLELDKTFSNEPIKFGDFQLASEYQHLEFKVLNPDVTLTYVGAENVPVNIKILYNYGIGYEAYNTTNKSASLTPEFLEDSITIDSKFTPVIHVATKILYETPNLQQDSFELTVETDGSISPIDAVRFAAETMKADAAMLSSLFDLKLDTLDVMLNATHSDAEYAKPSEKTTDSEVEVLGLPTEIYSLVKDSNLNKIGELMDFLKGAEVVDMKDIKTLDANLLGKRKEIIELLTQAGFDMSESAPVN